ncbi:MAPEG family protein [Pseudomarimonas salicorniae]|uniref:MAPEG family protein n=1 Tax=Pseudomarimonas salicorniae TaxID=2933270 RepID=A0ABT0GMR1_9GAMM|nr:MAPEG family protein [Lysobacter sp. CAU 1642]MCK7595287.1 MAPEG family protein [Lysobacter sp. CAU 1642]
MTAIMLPVTSLYAALLGQLILALALNVIRHRRRAGVALGDGGDRQLMRAMRAHGNAIETVPVLLILMLLLELAAFPTAWLHGLGATLLISRLLHAGGLLRRSGPSPGRLWGMGLSLLLALLMPLMLIWHVVLAG